MIQEVVEQVQAMVRETLNNEVHTAMPAQVVAYNDDGTVNVQPLGSFYTDGIEMPYPIIPSVPVQMPFNNKMVEAAFPVEEDDTVLLVFAEQSLSRWRTDTSQAQKDEKFELTNAIAIPNLVREMSDAQKEANEKKGLVIMFGEDRQYKAVLTADGVEIEVGESKVTINEEGVNIEAKVQIKGDVEIEGNLNTKGSVSADGDVNTKGGVNANGAVNDNKGNVRD